MGSDELADHQLQAASVPTGNHRPCGVAVLSLSPEPSPGRGDAAGARHRRLLRDAAALGSEVRGEYARRLRRKKPSPRDIWHLDEVVATIAGKKRWLWRAVEQDGPILHKIVQTPRDTKAARRLLTRLLKKQGCPPWHMITGKLGSYAAARRQIMPAIEHRAHKGLNNRAKNSHVPLRKRERAMQGFRSPGSLQRFVAAFSAVRNLFVPPRLSRSALATHLHRRGAMAHWKAVAGVTA